MLLTHPIAILPHIAILLGFSGKEKELLAMKQGGNKLINSIYEANLTDGEKENFRPTNQTAMEARAAFIFDKYQHRKYYDISTFYQGSSEPAKKEKSAYKPPPAFGQSSENEVDSFLGSRQSQRESGGFLEDFIKERDTDWWKMNAKPRGEMGNTGSDSTKEIQFEPSKSSQRRSSAQSPLAQSRQSKDLLQTLQRMESKSRLLDDIKHMEIDLDNPLPSPKKASRSSKRRERDRQIKKLPTFGTVEKMPTSEDRNRGVSRSKSFDSPNVDGRRKTAREVTGGHETISEASSGRPSVKDRRRVAPGRSKSYSDDADEPRKGGSRAAAEDRRQRVLGRTSSFDEGDVEIPSSMRSRVGESKPSSSRRTIRRGSDVDSTKLDGSKEMEGQKLNRLAGGSEHTDTSASRRFRREPRRGVGRTRSMDSDCEFGVSKPRSSRLTRPPRSSVSGDLRMTRGHESACDFRGFDASGSELSTISAGSSNRGSRGDRSRTDDDVPPSSSRSGRSGATDELGARRSARARSVGAKTARTSRKPSGSNKSRSPQREEMSGRSRGANSSRTPSPPGNESRRRRDMRQLPPASPARRSPGTSNIEELGRLLSGS